MTRAKTFQKIVQEQFFTFVNMAKNKNDSEEMNVSKPTISVALTMISIPLSMILWISNILFRKFYGDNVNELDEGLPPLRWFISTFIPLFIAVWGYTKRSLNLSGALLGVIVGFVLTLSSYGFLACLLTFFVTSSRATKFRSKTKKQLEPDFKEGGQRNWIQVLCNGGMATQLALLYILDVGCGELPVDFKRYYRPSWLSIGILGAFSSCNGDTWASELATVLDTGLPLLITTGKPVPKGTNGGVSVIGLVVSLLGGMAVGLANYAMLIYTIDADMLARSPAQWPIIVAGGFAGLVGSVVDSVLGATLQYSGFNRKTGAIVEHPGKDVVHISGRRILDNHSVNLISSVIMGIVTPKIAYLVWP
ncbi:transmembrane protein 19 [Metopolophium dirhodum]|uniref:transmembrane protein 19 n=1 Tax=Metopolophium dirhodum TaxID=44670 RepID=UPI00298FFDD5|nr:transmembrane protein 19 [Metopolophium dirhodum]